MFLKQKKSFLTLIAVFFFLFSLGTIAQAQSNFPRDTLSIKTADNVYNFDIELALDDNHRQYGLMYRDHLPEMSGMLFIYDRARNIAMWMKNTFIPLDIVFIDEAGKIINIAKSAKPKDLSQIPSKGPAKAALELNGGLTDKLGINVGDEILYPTFGNTDK
ncbi:MAG: DUF192 domain-containing protein [Emcibacteraceae bacterium]